MGRKIVLVHSLPVPSFGKIERPVQNMNFFRKKRLVSKYRDMGQLELQKV